MTMPNFSFDTNTSFISNSANYLRPFDVYEVKLTKIEKTILKGSKNPEASYKIVALEFTGEDGVYTQNLFIPEREEDFIRSENPSTHKQMPSSWDRFQYTLMQLVQVITPTGFEKYQKVAGKIKSIDEFIDIVVKLLTSAKDTSFFLKLVGRNVNGTMYAQLPNACLIADGEVKPLNFVSTDRSKLRFSNYEMQQMKNYQTAKPTAMPDEPKDDDGGLDLDEIEL